MQRILVIDDERSLRVTLKDILEFENYEVVCAEDGEEGLNQILNNHFDLILCDIKMPKYDGIELLKKVKEDHEIDIPFIMISGHGDIDTVVEVLKKGAFDYIQKPLDLNRILVTIRNGLSHEKLTRETHTLRQKTSSKHIMIGEHKSLIEVKEMIEKVAQTEARVLITGENGTGKEITARLIHEQSERRKKPFIEVNCAAIPPELIESELFGHEKGSFTSAIKQRIGKFEQANDGTLFLDEIGDMSLSAQTKVLRVLQENNITRVGGLKQFRINVRVLCATNQNIKEMIKEGKFREDLYHRINVIPIHLPPLRERSSDIPILVDYFVKMISKEQGRSPKKVSKGAMRMLQSAPWPGNIRELRNVIERLLILSNQSIEKEDVIKYL